MYSFYSFCLYFFYDGAFADFAISVARLNNEDDNKKKGFTNLWSEEDKKKNKELNLIFIDRNFPNLFALGGKMKWFLFFFFGKFIKTNAIHKSFPYFSF